MRLASSLEGLPALLATTIVALAVPAGAALAQSRDVAAVYDMSHVVPTAVSGITTFPAPPAGYAPLTASDAQNARYGYPPRPDKVSDPDAYALWARAMAVASKRSSASLRVTGMNSGPMQQPGSAQRSSTAGKSVISTNWSGVVSLKNVKAWNPKTSFAIAAAAFNVPVAQQAFDGGGGNICDNGWDSVVLWVGLDGYKSNDVLHGGIAAGAFCANNGAIKQTLYYAWIGWHPNPDVFAFNVNPGDDIFAEVWNTSPTQGYVFILDLTTQVSGSYSLTAPAGAYLVGNSAEYIVARPCCVGGEFFPLANYVLSFWAGAVAAPFKGATVSPSKASTIITMTDNGGANVISTVEGLTTAPKAQSQILFGSTNCAKEGGCTP